MYLLKFFSNIGSRLISLRYAARTACVSKHLQGSGSTRFLRSHHWKISEPVLFLKHSPFSNFYPTIYTVIGERWKQSSIERKKSAKDDTQEVIEISEKLSLFQRYKKMLKEYWYVLVPVHMVTSALWFGSFYYAAKCGLDIIPFLEYINLPEKLIHPLRSSSLGHIAVASAIYKLATPARYMVTLGGTTYAVRVLTKRGLIRPVPTKAQIKTIIQKKLKKDNASEHDT